MRPKLKEESTEIDKMSVHMLNYYQDAEAHIDEMEEEIICRRSLTNGNKIIHEAAKQQIKELKDERAEIERRIFFIAQSIFKDLNKH